MEATLSGGDLTCLEPADIGVPSWDQIPRLPPAEPFPRGPKVPRIYISGGSGLVSNGRRRLAVAENRRQPESRATSPRVAAKSHAQ